MNSLQHYLNGNSFSPNIVMRRACESCAFYSTSNEDPPDHLLLGCFITKVIFPTQTLTRRGTSLNIGRLTSTYVLILNIRNMVKSHILTGYLISKKQAESINKSEALLDRGKGEEVCKKRERTNDVSSVRLRKNTRCTLMN